MEAASTRTRPLAERLSGGDDDLVAILDADGGWLGHASKGLARWDRGSLAALGSLLIEAYGVRPGGPNLGAFPRD